MSSPLRPIRRPSNLRRARIAVRPSQSAAAAPSITQINAPPVRNWSAVTSLITAITAVGALVFTGLSLNATREQNDLTEQSQITDRYSKAVEQIGRQGPEYVQVRLGGIYALERIARDSRRDQPTIIEVLAAFVRTASAKPENGGTCPNQPPRVDLQAVLTVLGRRDSIHDQHTVIDLQNSCLRGSGLRGADLTHTVLVGADLTNALLVGANLSGANLSTADLTGAVLGDANLSGANLNTTHLAGAVLGDANLSRTSVIAANLRGAVLINANLRGANLSRANLSTADLYHANLSTADLTSTDLRGAHLARADLTGTDLGGTDLRDADLTGADLRRTDLSRVNRDEATQTDNVLTDGDTQGAWW